MRRAAAAATAAAQALWRWSGGGAGQERCNRLSLSFLLADGFAIGPRRWFNLLIRCRLARRAAAASIRAERLRETEGKRGKTEVMKDGGGDAGK